MKHFTSAENTKRMLIIKRYLMATESEETVFVFLIYEKKIQPYGLDVASL